MSRIGVIGLGVMGGAMARNLLGAGHEVVGFDVDESRRDELVTAGGIAAGSVGEVAANVDVALFSLPTQEALAEVASMVAEHARPGLICLELGTFDLGSKMAAQSILAEHGVELLDTPVSGTGLQAADATLVVFGSGDRGAFEAVQPVFDAIGRSTYYLGEFGNGSRMKYVANLLVAVHNLATAEAHVLGLAAGLDPARVQEVVSDGVGSSKIFEIRGPMMVGNEYSPTARLDIALKDSRIIKEFATSVGAPTPLLDAALPVYLASSEAGLGSLDAAALCRQLEGWAGIDRPPSEGGDLQA